jgi:hypothetical protein
MRRFASSWGRWRICMKATVGRRICWDMRLEALRLMRLLDAFHPRFDRQRFKPAMSARGRTSNLHVFSNHLSAITAVLEDQRLQYSVEKKRVVKQNEERVFYAYPCGRSLQFRVDAVSHGQDQLSVQKFDHGNSH